jgi:hypothetical protein
VQPEQRAPRSASIVAVVRLLVVVLVAVGVGSGLFLRARPGHEAAAAARYACPMHPEVTAAAPGNCPVCGMALEPARAAAPASGGGAADPAAFNLVPVRPHTVAREVRAAAAVDDGGVLVALLSGDEAAAALEVGHAAFAPAAAPERSFAVRPTGEPPVAWDSSTSRVRFRFDDAGVAPGPGAAGWLLLSQRPLPVLVVPDAAILLSPDGPYVLVASADGRTLSRRAVTVGRSFYRTSAVVSGLVAGERIAIDRAFYLDAERRLREGTPP